MDGGAGFDGATLSRVLFHLHRAVVKRGSTPQVGEPLVGQFIHIGTHGAELAPPYAQAVDYAGPGARADLGFAVVLAAGIEDAHLIAIGNTACHRVLGMDFDFWFAFDTAQAFHVHERGVHEITCRG